MRRANSFIKREMRNKKIHRIISFSRTDDRIKTIPEIQHVLRNFKIQLKKHSEQIYFRLRDE